MPTLKTLGIGLATAGILFAGIAWAEEAVDLKPGDDWAAFEKFTEKKVPPCHTCHSLDKKIVGPAYKDVAAKRKEDAAKDKEGTVKMLAEKIMKGNAGSPAVYGGAVMTPNTMVTEEEAKKLAEWVLALDSGEAKAEEAKEEAKPEETKSEENK